MSREQTVTEMELLIKNTQDPAMKQELALKFATALMASAPPVKRTTLGGAPPVMDPDPTTMADEQARRVMIMAAACALSNQVNRSALDLERQLTAAMAGVGAGLTAEAFGILVNAEADRIAVSIQGRIR